jgi:hypothetical protein
VLAAVGNQADKSPQPNRDRALTEDDEDDAERWRDLAGTGPSFGRLFLERLLLSLIDAHPNPKVRGRPNLILHERERRLHAAMEALFNEKKEEDENASEQLHDRAALLWIAAQYAHDRQLQYVQQQRQAREVAVSQPVDAQKAVRSERQLAREASEKFYPDLADQSERLRKKWRDPTRKQFWLAMMRWGDGVPETMETHALAKIWIALTEADVPVIPNWPDGRPMTDDQMLRTGLGELARLVEVRRKGTSRA